MAHLRIKPDSRLTNTQVEQLVQTLHLYQSPIDRWNGRGFNRESFVSFETVLEKEKTAFYLTVKDDTKDIAKKAIETAWSKVTVEEVDNPLPDEIPTKTAVMSMKYHYMFAIKVDRRETSYLASLLETLNIMSKHEKIFVQVLATPAANDWHIGAANAYDRFKSGQMPYKLQINKRELTRSAVKLAAKTSLEVSSIVTELITGEEPEKVDLDGVERATILRDGKLRNETLTKTRGDAFNTIIRVAVKTDNETRAAALLRMVTMAFRNLDGDNQLITNETNAKKMWANMQARKLGFSLASDYLSTSELSRLCLLPSCELQDKYKIPNIRTLETDVKKILLEDGLKLGSITYKGINKDVYKPSGNYDELCLPHIAIGGMGTGKTRGFAANHIVGAVNNGFGALAIDPAKGEIGDEVEAVLPAHKVVRIRLGEQPIALDWREADRSSKARNRLANTIIGFFNSADVEAGAQTARYLRASVMAMQTGKLSEIIRILEDSKYRKEVLNMATGLGEIHINTLRDLDQMSDNRRLQVLSPIYNRLDIILGDQYLNECMDADDGIDLVEIMEQRKAFIIDVPKSELGPEAVDLIVNLLSTKIDLAMTLRDESKQHPFFVLFDEPHQFLRSAKLWQSAAVESRKWRVGYIWLFHSWEQIPRKLAEIVKAAGPHYTIYNSSKKTFVDLAEEIAPIPVTDAMKLKRHHAINIIRAGNEIQEPFIAHMNPPPSMKKVSPNRHNLAPAIIN